jgi:hypothetical protein
MKVHITLEPSVRNDPVAKSKVLARLENEAGVRDVNLKRFDRYGIVSGEVDEHKVEDVRRMSEVKAVEADERRFAS